MDLDTWLLFAVVGLMVANRAMHVGPRWHRRKFLFWFIQLTNFVGACLLATFGIPGFAGPLRIVNLMFSGLLVLHIVQNNRHYAEAWRGSKPKTEKEREALRDRVLERLSGSENGSEPGHKG
jgi:hypothetical protein